MNSFVVPKFSSLDKIEPFSSSLILMVMENQPCINKIPKHYNICLPFPGLTACSSGSFGAGGSSMAFGGSLGGSSMALGRLFIICLKSPTVTWWFSGLQFYSVKYSAKYQWQKHENSSHLLDSIRLLSTFYQITFYILSDYFLDSIR